MVGVLYLENRLSDEVFTLEKTRMTELLTLQAAMSLENARFQSEVTKSQERIDALTKQLSARERVGSS